MNETVMPGYKLTEVGVVPEDWIVKQLGELASSIGYGSSAKSDRVGLVPVLRMGNLQDGKIDWTNLVYTSDSNEIDKYLLSKKDILFNRTNTIDLVGKSSIYTSDRPAIFAGYLIRVKVNQTQYSAEYLNYILNTSVARNYSMKVLSLAVGQANINGEKLKTYPIPIPPTLPEQARIVEAL
ncbi:MAG: restriction endonuclease subunit S, partial [Spirochaetes bacterium]|nr:restriction endonuclease subunit S [Spirochaetota bacterium]